MINYTDIVREAYEDNHINFVDYFHAKEKKSIKNQRIEAMFFEWFLAKAQVIERDFFINIDTFIPNCLNQCTIVIRGLSATNEKNSMIIDLSFMLLALDKMNKTMDEADEQGSDIPDVDIKDFDFDMLEKSGFPVIDTNIFDPDLIFEKYHNIAFACSRVAFYAWLVYGKIYKEKIRWILKHDKGRHEGKIKKVQAKVFIDLFTNTNDIAKEAYFKKVFIDLEIKKSDYKNSGTVDPIFEGDLRTLREKIKK